MPPGAVGAGALPGIVVQVTPLRTWGNRLSQETAAGMLRRMVLPASIPASAL